MTGFFMPGCLSENFTAPEGDINYSGSRGNMESVAKESFLLFQLIF